MIIRWVPRVKKYAVVAEPGDRTFLRQGKRGPWLFKRLEAAERFIEVFEDRVVRA